jgi:hypothetical protein
VCEQTLINDKRFWKLGNGLWWASPEWLATDNRLQDLKKQRINHPYLAIEKLISLACSLRLNELSSEEKNLLMRAFSKKLLSLEPSFLQTDNVERKIPSEKPEIRIVPPKRIRFTLTDERIRKGRIPITPGLVQILSACQCASGIELTTFADFILRAQINKTDRCLEGRDIAKWYNEEKLAPGDIVYVCAPEGERGTMRLFTAFEVRTGEKMTHKVETQGHNPMYLRDRIHQILEQNGKIMTVLELCIVLSKSLGSEVNHGSVSGALNYNSHLFVGWGGKHWGLIEWGQDWRSRVDKEALLMRISEEDLVVEILKDFRRWITNRQIANEIAKKFVLTSDFVLETSFIDTNDDRLCRRGESWGLLDWTKPCGFSWFAPLQDDSNFKLLVDEWLLQKWGIKLGELAKEVGIAQKN